MTSSESRLLYVLHFCSCFSVVGERGCVRARVGPKSRLMCWCVQGEMGDLLFCSDIELRVVLDGIEEMHKG